MTDSLRYNKRIMEIESVSGLSRKSRGILYQLKKKLDAQKKTLKDHVCEIFGFEKMQFKKQEFFFLIKVYDDKLVLSQLDELFTELDDSCNEIVFIERIKAAYQTISEADDPLKPNEKIIERAASRISTRHKLTDLVEVYKEVRKVLTSSEDIIEIIYLFGVEN